MRFRSLGLCGLFGVLVAQRVAEILVEGRVPRPLNQAAARRVVVRRRQRQAGAAADAIDRLHQRLAERRLADDVGAIVILQRAGDDLRRAGAVAVGEHHDRDVGELAVFGRAVVLIGIRDAAARVDDHLAACGRNSFDDLDRLIERTARDCRGCRTAAASCPSTARSRSACLTSRSVFSPKSCMPDVAGRRVDHEVRRHGRDVDLVARHLERNQLLVAAPLDLDLRRACPSARAACCIACSVVQPLASSPAIFAMTSPRRMPFL